MKQKVQQELKRLKKENIIRPVKMRTDWCAPIVAVLKNNGKVWHCVDFTKLNKSVKTDCEIVVREFVLQSRYYVHFRANTLGKGMNPLILPAMG